MRLSRTTAAAALVIVAAGSSVALAPPSSARTAGTTPGSAGVIEAAVLYGTPRLGARSTVTAMAFVRVPRATQGSISLTLGRQTCTGRGVVPAGRSRLSVVCAATPAAATVPALAGAVRVTLDRVDAGRIKRSTRTGRPSLALSDGPALADQVAAARWSAVVARLRAAAAPAATTARAATTVRAQGAGYVTAAAFTPTAANAAAQVWQQAQASGWHSASTTAALATLRRLRTASGGYGLGTAWDAFGDGTRNPASTTYTVTTAGHVGWVLLEARKNDADGGALNGAIDALLAMPRLDQGRCLAYSNSRYDRAKPCVYNVSHGAAAFLVQARALSTHRSGEVDALIAALRSGLRRGYDPATGYWRYKAGDRVAQDISHQIYTARSVDVVDPTFGAVARMMARPWWRQPGGMRQRPVDVASAMLDVAKDCARARSPAVLLGVERAAGAGAPAFTVVGMSNLADEIRQSCFG